MNDRWHERMMGIAQAVWYAPLWALHAMPGRWMRAAMFLPACFVQFAWMAIWLLPMAGVLLLTAAGMVVDRDP